MNTEQLSVTDATDVIVSAEEIIAEAGAGRMFILVDDEDRENEGDLIITADAADATAINFMALHGRGLICLAMQGALVDKLRLPLMASSNQSRHETAFTVSIEAREGVTTGISAQDRAHTILTAIDPNATEMSLASPGHVFPLRARDGGVLIRAGHTEAAVDVARLAGRSPAGVICEIMNSDGTMARMQDLIPYAREHGLKIGTIASLIAFRRKEEGLIERVEEATISSMWGGEWRMRVYRDKAYGEEHYALFKGNFDENSNVIVRMHVLDPLEDILGLDPSRATQVPDAMKVIANEGAGAVVMLRDHSSTAISERLKVSDTVEKNLRRYGLGAEILRDLNIRKVVLLSNSPAPKLVALEGFDLMVTGSRGF